MPPSKWLVKSSSNGKFAGVIVDSSETVNEVETRDPSDNLVKGS